MKRSVKSLIGFTMGATDGEIGKVKDFYFDDETWTIRYLIVDTGNWLTGRVVLISTEAVLIPDWTNKIFPTNLTKEQIKNSPDINTELPVSRQEEIKLYKYYPWMVYWSGEYYGGYLAPLGDGAFGMGEPRIESIDPQSQNQRPEEGEVTHNHLRSTNKVKSYKIQATDGEIGDVEDFLLDDNNWKIDFIMIDTGNWFSGKKVLLSPARIKEIKWETSAVLIDKKVDDIKNSPEWNPKKELTEVYTLQRDL